MADIHLASAGLNTAPYDTWAKAATTWAAAVTTFAAGDRLLIDSTFTETAASFAKTFPGTNPNANFVLSGVPAAISGLASLSPGALLNGSGTAPFTISGSCLIYGVDFLSSSASSSDMGFARGASNHMILDNCTTRFTGAAASSALIIGNEATGDTRQHAILRNHSVRFAHSGQRIYVQASLAIEGGAWLSGGTTPTGVFYLSEFGRGARLVCNGFDFSALGAAVNIIQLIDTQSSITADFNNCKLPASHSGVIIGTMPTGAIVNWTHGDNADTNYRFAEHRYAGVTTHEVTIVRTGGASDGTTPISSKMVTTANAGFPCSPLIHALAPVWIDTTGAAKTVDAHVIHDSVTNLKDDEVALRLMYLGTSGFPLASFAHDARAILATAADQAASTETWTTTGLTNPNKQKLSVAVTPQEKGWFVPQVELYKPSTTLYVCPELEVS